MVEIALPKNSKPTEGRTWPHAPAAREEREFRVYRYDPEGGKNPLAKFEEELTTTSPSDQSRFYCGNMAELLTGNPALVDAG